MRIEPSRPGGGGGAALLAPRGKPWLAAATVFYLTMLVVGNLPGQAQALNQAFGDKLMHLSAYACLSGAICLAVSRHKAAITLASIAVLGGLDEVIQSFFPYRSSDLADLLTDLTAAVLAIALLSLANALVSARARKDAGDANRSLPPSTRAHENHHHR
ncbi:MULTISPECIES: VanZ family protein [Cupriavidus]